MPLPTSTLGYRHVVVDGWSFWAHPVTGRVLPLIAGASDDPPPGGPPAPPAPPEPAATFTQADLDAVAGRARAEARRAAATELAEQLGCTVEEAKAKIAAATAAEDATKTEAQKALEAAQAAQAAADQARAEAQAERLAARVERKLIAAGVPDAALARATRLIAVDQDADDAAIDGEITALKTELPGIFTPGTPAPTPPPGITPPGKPPTGGGQSALERGAARFTARQSHTAA